MTIGALRTVWHGSGITGVHHHPNILRCWRGGSPSTHPSLQSSNWLICQVEKPRRQRGEVATECGRPGFQVPVNATSVGRSLQLPGLKARPPRRTGRDIVQWLRVCVMCDLCENLRSCLSIWPPYFSGECLRPATHERQDQTGRSYSGLFASRILNQQPQTSGCSRAVAALWPLHCPPDAPSSAISTCQAIHVADFHSKPFPQSSDH